MGDDRAWSSADDAAVTGQIFKILYQGNYVMSGLFRDWTKVLVVVGREGKGKSTMGSSQRRGWEVEPIHTSFALKS